MEDEDLESGLDAVNDMEATDEAEDAATEDVEMSPLEIARRYRQADVRKTTAADELKKQLEAARNVLLQQPTQISRSDKLLGIASTLLAPGPVGRAGTIAESLGGLGKYLSGVSAEEREAKQAQAKALAQFDTQRAQQEVTAATEEQKALASLLGKYAGKKDTSDEITRLQIIRDSLDLRDPRRAELTRRIAYLGGEREDKGIQATPGEKEVDKKVGAEYADWVVGGKGAQAASRIAKVDNIISQLDDRKDISGPAVGFVVENLPTLASTLYPEAQDAKDVVESVVQTDLKAILGGQFGQAEGFALIKRAYNPRLQEWQNAKRLKLLNRQMKMVLNEKNNVMNYFGEKGTIKGYAFKPYTPDDFLTPDQLKRLDAGESIESILGEAPVEKPKPKPAAGAPAGAAKNPAQKAADELARRRAAKGG